jgi:hypothetical protein
MIPRRGLTEQFPPPGDDDAAVEAVPPVADPPPVDAPAEPQTLTAALDANRLLQATVAELRARVAALESRPEESWITLKTAAHNAFRPTSAKDVKNAGERMRRLVESGEVEAKKVNGAWLVDENGVKMRERMRLLMVLRGSRPGTDRPAGRR